MNTLDNANNNDTSEKIVIDLISELLPTKEVANAVIDGKLRRQAVLLDNPASNKKNEQVNSRDGMGLPDGRLSVRRRRQCNRVIGLPPASAANYEHFMNLHNLWQQYATDVLGKCDKRSIGNKMLKMDFHGAIICVVRSLNPTTIGVQGIVVRETQHTFQVVTSANKFKTLIKGGTWFEMKYSRYRITIFGDQMRLRPAERASRKFKMKNTIALWQP